MALWMNPKRDIQRPRIPANVRGLFERRGNHAPRSWDNPESKPQSRATVRSRVAGLTLRVARAEGIYLYLPLLWPSACVCSCTWLRTADGSILAC